ncbi:MAG: hypothetical protein QGG71_24000 [Pirellulaceae bacterium]|jgi:hypothetical protein|nr:hypothetical protein [Pirellulaceae bacterium]
MNALAAKNANRYSLCFAVALVAGRVWFGLPAPERRYQHDRYGPFTVNITEAGPMIERSLVWLRSTLKELSIPEETP